MTSRRGDREEALKLWELSADIAIAEMVPLLALCVGLDCGGEEGAAILCAACKATGRPLDTLLDELSNAKDDQRIKFASGIWGTPSHREAERV